MLLSELNNKESGIIKKINGEGAFRKRISEMGFVKGQSVFVVKNAPLLDPVEYSIMGYAISLRRNEAALIEIEETISNRVIPSFPGTFNFSSAVKEKSKSEKTINIALVGNPNCGKTSIFNYASNSFEHVGNYGGVTVETKLARIEYRDYKFNIYDLPGTYSLNSYSPEELYVRNFISGNSPDVVVNVVDATNLERNLYLTTQLIDMDQRVVIALNMFDELKRKGQHFNHLSFAALLGIPVVPTVGSKGKGLARLFEAVISKYLEPETNRKKIHINYGKDIESSIKNIETAITNESDNPFTEKLNPRYFAIKLIENDDYICQNETTGFSDVICNLAEKERKKLKSLLDDEPETLLTDARYGFISGALKETCRSEKTDRRRYSREIDRLLTHKYLGIPVFFGFLWFMFEVTFNLGKYPMGWIESGMAWLSQASANLIPAGDFQNLLTNGIIGGVGGVIVFLPNILILFFFISFLEDTGYMARAAFIMDKVMHKIGLHGKSFIPLVMGFGCNVPAIMSTRIIETRNNRLLTMFILPFMSCSARLPVYILIIGAFFPNNQGTVLFGIYLTGILLAVLTALIFKKFVFRKEDSPFVMELPPYRIPTLRNTLRHMWHKGSQYIRKIGGIILVASIIIWGLEYYPKTKTALTDNGQNTTDTLYDKGQISTVALHDNDQIITTELLDNAQIITAELSDNGQITTSAFSSDITPESNTGTSYLERIGKSVQPVMEPLGFDWKMTICILSGIAGKELVVSTMGVLYDGNDHSDNLGERIRQEKYTQGERAGKAVINPAVALSFLMFILVYFPCMAVIATVAKESGSVMWAVFMMLYTTGLAWVMSFIVFKVAGLFF